ncbi:hypothetical protein DLAC_08371 [Tieghemostelium lacteum]|uniref:Uncharacterized protein n=1 Tax=Tieghemostelium lacteum TaxID=361077 RepID=A0A151ZBT9_TIELA|nr:hypothetical protein DLAC_08371 [Tieghemostelium lacteum]|eukprot:KYQ91406.1 hypothetical protein DLAC_08371 [Tieghemostelium lacteum]
MDFVCNGQLTTDSLPMYIESIHQQFPQVYQLKNKTPQHILEKTTITQSSSSSTSSSSITSVNYQHPLNNNNNNTISQSTSSNSGEYKYYDSTRNVFDKEKIQKNGNNQTYKEYIDELFKVYTGKVGDPASTQFLLKSLMDGSFTPVQAEMHVKFTKEAKAYSANAHIREAKKKKAEQYIYELYKIFVGPDYICPLDELNLYVKLILESPNPDYQFIEDEIKDKAFSLINIPQKKPFTYK